MFHRMFSIINFMTTVNKFDRNITPEKPAEIKAPLSDFDRPFAQ